MTDLVRFSFALSPRMHAFLELRDALLCLDEAKRQNHAYAWLHAATDIRSSLLGEQGRKPAVPEIIGLLVAMQTHLGKLAEEESPYRDSIQGACDTIDQHIQTLRPGIPEAAKFLTNDALICIYLNAQKKQDWLGHKPTLPQSLTTMWQQGGPERATMLCEALYQLEAIVNCLDSMLHDYVGWQSCIAENGSDQITPERGVNHGLIVIGLDTDSVARGIVPNISGNRLAIRLRFQSWQPGCPSADVEHDQAYAMMLVPVA
ncbi:MAG: hypothetical protein ACE5F3_06030 [Mariprofundaceae bacterium]